MEKIIASVGRQLVINTRMRPFGYTDPETNKYYVFITNNFRWLAQTIADIYK